MSILGGLELKRGKFAEAEAVLLEGHAALEPVTILGVPATTALLVSYAAVRDPQGNPLGRGYYSPASAIPVEAPKPVRREGRGGRDGDSARVPRPLRRVGFGILALPAQEDAEIVVGAGIARSQRQRPAAGRTAPAPADRRRNAGGSRRVTGSALRPRSPAAARRARRRRLAPCGAVTRADQTWAGLGAVPRPDTTRSSARGRTDRWPRRHRNR